MIFFDLEFYVPKNDRISTHSLIVNPNLKTHKLLGGTFYSKCFDEKIPNTPKFNQLWLWNYENDEKQLLREIYELFQQEWKKTKKEEKWILGKPIVDLVVCGIGISWFDISALYCRSVRFQIDSPEQLYNVYFKTRNIDLANVCSFVFPDEKCIYPKTAKEIMGRMDIKKEKSSSKNVWELFDNDDTDKIEKRTTEEIETILQMYRNIQKKISKG